MLNYRANSFPVEVWKVNVHYLLNQNFPISNIWIGEKIWKLLKTRKWNNLFSLLGGNKVTAIFRSNVTLAMVPATGHRLQILTISGAPVNICSGPLLQTWNIHPAILFPITVPVYNSIFTPDTCKIAFGWAIEANKMMEGIWNRSPSCCLPWIVAVGWGFAHLLHFLPCAIVQRALREGEFHTGQFPG